MRRWLAGSAVSAAFLMFSTGTASAHNNGLADYAYYVEAVPAPTYYRCAVAASTLQESGSMIINGATTKSKSAAFCASNYNVAAGNLAANHILWFKVSGVWTQCKFNDVTNTSSASIVYSNLTSSKCGSGQYKVGGFHRVYINGTARDFWSSSSEHTF